MFAAFACYKVAGTNKKLEETLNVFRFMGGKRDNRRKGIFTLSYPIFFCYSNMPIILPVMFLNIFPAGTDALEITLPPLSVA
ncbi:MAG: hypothetical protein M3M88_02065, partial [Thermoproteota archaeon]|nr:hypothetical protein [Thermoproteota archaeon]